MIRRATATTHAIMSLPYSIRATHKNGLCRFTSTTEFIWFPSHLRSKIPLSSLWVKVFSSQRRRVRYASCITRCRAENHTTAPKNSSGGGVAGSSYSGSGRGVLGMQLHRNNLSVQICSTTWVLPSWLCQISYTRHVGRHKTTPPQRILILMMQS